MKQGTVHFYLRPPPPSPLHSLLSVYPVIGKVQTLCRQFTTASTVSVPKGPAVGRLSSILQCFTFGCALWACLAHYDMDEDKKGSNFRVFPMYQKDNNNKSKFGFNSKF